MPECVLTVWQAGDDPPEGGAPMRLCTSAGELLAEHAVGFDTAPYLRDGVKITPEQCLSADGLMDTPSQEWVGDTLWTRLTPGAIGTAFADGTVAITDRVHLDLRSDGLKRLPWELLRRLGEDVFAAEGMAWCLGRPEPTELGRLRHPPIPDHPLRVLVVLGNKPDDTKIRARQELMIIEREAHRRNTDVLLRTLAHPSAPEIEAALEDFRPHVFHFIGHGGTDPTEPPQIYVYSEKAGFSDPWSAGRVRKVFARHPPRAVVLNACLTAHAPTQAVSLVDAFADAGCVATVTMLGEILGSASEAFSERFYRELFRGSAVDVATTRARLSVQAIAGGDQNALTLRSNWALPRLTVYGDVAEAVSLPYATQNRSVQWLQDDFVTRWDERWQAWRAMDGSLRGDRDTESRLVVLCGRQDAGKRELVNTLADARLRAGDVVLYPELVGEPSGRWPDLLVRIADKAALAGFDTVALGALALSGGTAAQVIPQFLAHLETLRRPDATAPPTARPEPMLIVLDGLSGWAEDEVRQTLLPLLCWPLVRASHASRLRMMITLEKVAVDGAWGPRPEGWRPIEVHEFAVDEWSRTVEHFRDHWLTEIDVRRPEKSNVFRVQADGVADARSAASLDTLRTFAKAILR